MHIHIQTLLHHFGYWGVGFILFLEMVGIPFPSETTLTFSGIAWANGTFHFLPVLLAAIFGNIMGSSVAFMIGRFLGRPILLRYGRILGITETRLHKAEQAFQKHGNKIVIFAKFIAGIRILIPYLAGMNRMPFRTFSLYNTISAFIWSTVFIIFGRYLGFTWGFFRRELHHTFLPVTLIIVVLVGIAFLIKKKLKLKNKVNVENVDTMKNVDNKCN